MKMRYKIIFGMLTLAAVLCTIGTGAAQIPGGSYQQTCRDIGTRGSTLYATCDNGNGRWVSTELRDFPRCSGQIQNISGNLRCTGNGGYDRGRDGDRDRDRDRGGYQGPPGSYAQTCQNISVNGDTLQASCQKRNGGWRQTSLRHFDRCRDIANNNGKLQCAR